MSPGAVARLCHALAFAVMVGGARLTRTVQAIGLLRWVTVVPQAVATHASNGSLLRPQLDWLLASACRHDGSLGRWVLAASLLAVTSLCQLRTAATAQLIGRRLPSKSQTPVAPTANGSTAR